MMIQDIGDRNYAVTYKNCQPKETDSILVFEKDTVLMKLVEGQITLPKKKELTGQRLAFTYLFAIDDQRFYRGVSKSDASNGCNESRMPKQDAPGWPKGYRFENVVVFRKAGPKYLAFAVITGYHMSVWYQKMRFCGVCATPMVHDAKERMMRCPACGEMYFPQICPAVIVAVTHKGKLLLTKYAGRSYKQYALIAGFNEIGESIEATVKREVMEEVGLKVKNITYYASQPWGLTSTMLMGFFCELDGDDETIRLDEIELADGVFLSAEEIPDSDETASLTREMINVFKAGRMPKLIGSRRDTKSAAMRMLYP